MLKRYFSITKYIFRLNILLTTYIYASVLLFFTCGLNISLDRQNTNRSCQMNTCLTMHGRTSQYVYAYIPVRLSIPSIQAVYTIARAYNVIARFPVPVCTRARTVTVHTDSGLGCTPNVLRSTFGVHPRRSSTYFIHCSSTVRPLFTRVSHSRKFSQIPGTFHTDMDEQWTWMNSGRTVDDIHCFLASLKGVQVSMI